MIVVDGHSNGLAVAVMLEQMVASARGAAIEAPVTVKMGKEVALWFQLYCRSGEGAARLSSIPRRYAGHTIDVVGDHPYLLEVVCD